MSRPETTPSGRGRPWTFVLVVLGIAVLAVVLRLHHLGAILLAQDRESAAIVADVHLHILSAHLWLEELLTGDEVASEEVRAHLEPFAAEMSRLRELGTEEDAELFDRLQRGLDWFAKLTERRLQGGLEGREVGVGTALDQEYDRVFAALEEELAELRGAIELRERRHRTQLSVFVGLAVALGLTLPIVSLIAFRHRVRDRRRREVAHREREAETIRTDLQSQKMEAVGRLAGGIAHDINNYLAAITAHCELVRMDAEHGSPTARKMDSVIGTASKASELIRRLLAFSRQKPPRSSAVRPEGVVEELAPMLRRLAGADVRLELRLAPEAGRVEIDPAQLEQVVVNLVVNAREAMQGGGTIVVETAAEKDPEGQELVLLVVEDDGPGIPLEIRDRIFEPYFTTKGPSGGSGLGLATVYGIVYQHGGTLQLVSEKGVGTRFEIRWPRSYREPTSLTRASHTRSRPAGGKETVLLVEDNEGLRQATSEMLERLGYGVATAPDAEEALQILDEDPGAFQLLLTDVLLPGRSGPELVAAVRERDPEIAAILVSGYRDTLVLQQGPDPADELPFLAKPFTSRDLDAKIREALGG